MKDFVKWYNSQDRLIKILLLLIPFVNWVVEVIIRWNSYLEKQDGVRLIVALCVSVFGLVFGWVDLVWLLLFDKLLLQ